MPRPELHQDVALLWESPEAMGGNGLDLNPMPQLGLPAPYEGTETPSEDLRPQNPAPNGVEKREGWGEDLKALSCWKVPGHPEARFPPSARLHHELSESEDSAPSISWPTPSPCPKPSRLLQRDLSRFSTAAFLYNRLNRPSNKP